MTGAAGANGANGAQGPAGPAGANGAQGPAGTGGFTVRTGEFIIPSLGGASVGQIGKFFDTSFGDVTWEIEGITGAVGDQHAGIRVRYDFENATPQVIATFLQDINRYTDNNINTSFSISLLGDPTSKSFTVHIVRNDSTEAWKVPHLFSVYMMNP